MQLHTHTPSFITGTVLTWHSCTCHRLPAGQSGVLSQRCPPDTWHTCTVRALCSASILPHPEATKECQIPMQCSDKQLTATATYTSSISTHSERLYTQVQRWTKYLHCLSVRQPFTSPSLHHIITPPLPLLPSHSLLTQGALPRVIRAVRRALAPMVLGRNLM